MAECALRTVPFMEAEIDTDSDLIYTKTVMEKKSLLEVEREFVDKLPSETINEMTCCLFLICL